ncbi:DNA mismatch repair protein MutS [Paenibacillus sp. N1-5-1-14]|uniref:endonuclease MutS2 n=1 Tax=Paenibacillus radicibacter TaxID=2972488 RepID=UPI0021599E61|nr:DNA mismatch repair protein MutS [Paenibacillus radicibacter]MCR8645989.1 DNA mismatch repair protein MutS [Paenibacillus radicibacter]
MNQTALNRLEYDKIKTIVRDYAVSYRGKQHVDAMIPLTYMKAIRAKLDEASEAKALLQKGASVPIPSLEGIEQIANLMHTGYVFSEQEFMHIVQFIRSCNQLKGYMASKEIIAPHVSSYASSMHDLRSVVSEIEASIRSGVIVDAASKDLMRIRKKINVCEERIKGKLDSLLSKHRSIMQENMVSTRGGRYVLPIKKEHRKLVKGAVLDESASGQTVYIEPADLADLQYQRGMLKSEEGVEETKILSDLTMVVERYAAEFLINVDTVGAYDFLFAKAKFALSIGGANVDLNEEGIIELHEARHPLMGGKMVPLNFQIGSKYNSLVITGPNTGGKTLALKTVGTLTIMIQSGLLVPVQAGSKLAVFEHVAVDIGDGQSIEHALSTFSAHIRNVIDILKIANHSTLVLIDEMASGTDPGEGVGLSIAILEELQKRKATVVATTHFSEIKNFASVTPGFENARMEFNTETLEPLYKLKIGEAGQSYAFLIAKKLGLPMPIINRSSEIAAKGVGTSGSEFGVTFGATSKPSEVQSKPVISSQEELSLRGVPDIQVNKEQMQVAKEVPVTNEVRVSKHSSSKHKPKVVKAQDDEAIPVPVKKFELGDSVYVSYLGRAGIVCTLEDAMGNVGVMIQKQKFKINKKRLKLHIAGKELYPEDYDLDIVLETKENRKIRKLMNRKYVPGLSIEKKVDE